MRDKNLYQARGRGIHDEPCCSLGNAPQIGVEIQVNWRDVDGDVAKHVRPFLAFCPSCRENDVDSGNEGDEEGCNA